MTPKKRTPSKAVAVPEDKPLKVASTRADSGPGKSLALRAEAPMKTSYGTSDNSLSITVTHTNPSFTGTITVLGSVVLGFTNGTATASVPASALGVIDELGFQVSITGGPSTPGYDANLDALVKPIVSNTSSTTNGALRAALAAPEINEEYAQYPDGPLTTTRTGRPYLIYPTSGAAKPVVSGGKLGFGAGATDGGYASVELDRPVRRIGGVVQFGPWTQGGGLVAFPVWVTDIGASFDASLGVPQSPFHLIVAPDSWSVGVFDTQGSSVRDVEQGLFTPNLSTDTPYTVDAYLDPDSGTATVLLPDGSIVEVADAAMKNAGRFACVEPYRLAGNTGATQPEILDWWADSRDTANAGRALAARAARSPAGLSGQYLTGSAVTTPIGTSFTQVTSVNITIPPSGKLWLQGWEYLSMTADTGVYVQAQVGGTAARGFTELVTEKAVTGLVHFAGVLDVSDLYPGDSQPLTIWMLSGDGTSASHVFDPSNHKRTALLTTPLP